MEGSGTDVTFPLEDQSEFTLTHFLDSNVITQILLHSAFPESEVSVTDQDVVPLNFAFSPTSSTYGEISQPKKLSQLFKESPKNVDSELFNTAYTFPIQSSNDFQICKSRIQKLIRKEGSSSCDTWTNKKKKKQHKFGYRQILTIQSNLENLNYYSTQEMNNGNLTKEEYGTNPNSTENKQITENNKRGNDIKKQNIL
ncbi:hypothetical protein MKS88_000628 [Plasmodium brasilianum]|uniref:Uncharacterized protein n=1 Tax=Plasmodium brasilianum TaxID=5824 RepID=A0ACB9YEH5_PLABR|nr:hypothetical protein MKS88_000628 [Plasmodium brasilianum]